MERQRPSVDENLAAIRDIADSIRRKAEAMIIDMGGELQIDDEHAMGYDVACVSIVIDGRDLVGPKHEVAPRIAAALEDAKDRLFAEYTKRNRHGRQ